MKASTNGRIQYIRPLAGRNSINQGNKRHRLIRPHVPLRDDIWICRFIVIILGLVILMIITGIFALCMKGDSIKIEVITICTAISSGAIGTLAGLLAPSPNRQ
ncbi:hypothetical protein [Chryseobacterium arthrosphaerae]|uniref:hypothetical protein n=1 Tax=Chryseobacterium arthrosphaerae TaxID=651561 RepID=UPI00241C22C7|nr:hypothetical protein [Chryseobacterium arthrosphaerae]